MPDNDGVYFTYALKPNKDGSGGEGKNAVLWYRNFKFSRGNDNETPDDNVQTAVLYPIAPGIPPDTDFVVLERNDGPRDHSITLTDKSRISGTIKLTGVEVGYLAGSMVHTTDAKAGGGLLVYSIIRGDGHVIFTDEEGYEHKVMHYAANPRHPVDGN